MSCVSRAPAALSVRSLLVVGSTDWRVRTDINGGSCDNGKCVASNSRRRQLVVMICSGSDYQVAIGGGSRWWRSAVAAGRGSRL